MALFSAFPKTVIDLHLPPAAGTRNPSHRIVMRYSITTVLTSLHPTIPTARILRTIMRQSEKMYNYNSMRSCDMPG